MTITPQQTSAELQSEASPSTWGRIARAAVSVTGATAMVALVLSASVLNAGSTVPSSNVTPGASGSSPLLSLDKATKTALNSAHNSYNNSVGGGQSTTPPASNPLPQSDFSADNANTPSPNPQTSDGQDNCGGVTIAKANGTPWVCSFDDEFTGTTLNPNKWLVEQTAQNGYHSGNECYEDNPNNVSVDNGVLELTAQKMATPITCASPGGDYTTPYTSGEVTTDYRFDQTYGLYEVRAKLPASAIAGLQETFWLWPQDQNRYGPMWPDSGEIDFAEFYSEYQNTDIPVLHYHSSTVTDPSNTAQCAIPNPDDYNTYALEWTSTTMTMFINGQACMSDTWHPMAPESGNEPFNEPFFLCLTQAIGVDSDNATSATQFPATTYVNWVRVWS